MCYSGIMTSQFVSKDVCEAPVKVGNTMASALAGFIAGAVFVSIIWVAALNIAAQYVS